MRAVVIVDFIDDEYIERHETGQLDLFTTAHLDAGLCRYGQPGTCTEPATHVAVGVTDVGPYRPERHVARLECCLPHANYYARGWLAPHLLYPAMRGAVWIERLVLVAA